MQTCSQTNQPRSDRRLYILASLLIGIFAVIVIKDISLPLAVMIPLRLAAAAALLYATVSRPVLLLMMVTAYLPFSKILVGQFGAQMVGFNLTNILTFLLAASWILDAQRSRQPLFHKSTLNPVIFFFFMLGLVSVLRAKFLYGGAYDLEYFVILFKRWATPIFMYVIGLNMVRNKETFKKVLFVMGLLTFVVALMAIRDYLHYGDRGSMEASRIGGVFDQPNMLGAFFVYNMFFFLSFFLYYWRSWRYWLLLIPLLACFRGIMVTFSRGAYLACAFGAFMTAFFRGKVIFFLACVTAIVILLNPVLLPEGIQQRLAATFGGQKVISTDLGEITDPSASQRIMIWKGSLEMIKEQPLFGFGYATFPYMIGVYAPGVSGMDAHNTYLITAAEMGMPALLVFLFILFLLIKNSRWIVRHSRDRYFKGFALGVLGGICGLLMANMFGSRLNSEEISAYFWLLSGLTIRAVLLVQEQLHAERKNET